MPDREKVIIGLERCKLMNKVNCDKCPYDYNGRGNGKSECTAELATDALALLKEQEHKDKMYRALESDWKRLKEQLKEQEEETQNLRRENHNILTQFHEWAKEQEAVEPKSHPAKAWTRAKTLWFCGACGARISKRKTKFCQECGRSVKW